MLTLTLRTDKPEAELGLYNGSVQLDYYTWQAHRQLAETIHLKIKKLLMKNKRQFSDLEAIMVYKGPGSFTGLRIGISVANALAQSLNIPIAGAENNKWLEVGLKKIESGQTDSLVAPTYGALPNITKPKH